MNMRTFIIILLAALAVGTSAMSKVVTAFGNIAAERRVEIRAAMNLGATGDPLGASEPHRTQPITP